MILMKKGAAVAQSVDEYLASVPEPAHTTLGKLRATIRAAAPKDATEAISYGMPSFRYKGGPLVYYAAFAEHCSFFPASVAVLQQFAEELKAYSTSKGTIRFPTDKPPAATLVKKMVKARVAQIDAKATKKKR